MIVKLLTEHHLEFLSLKEGCKGMSESTHVKIPHCWKSHALAHLLCGAGSVEKKIDIYKVDAHNSEGCCFIVLPGLVRSVSCSYLSIDVL